MRRNSRNFILGDFKSEYALPGVPPIAKFVVTTTLNLPVAFVENRRRRGTWVNNVVHVPVYPRVVAVCLP
jgi:hypothetical protein